MADESNEVEEHIRTQKRNGVRGRLKTSSLKENLNPEFVTSLKINQVHFPTLKIATISIISIWLTSVGFAPA